MPSSPYQTLGDIRNAVLRDFKESTATQIVSLVDRWINQGQEEVIFRHKRDFLNQTYTFDMQGSVDIGDAVVTSGGVSITYTSTNTLPTINTLREYSVQVASNEEIYKVSSYTSTSITLANTFKGDSSTSASLVFFQSAFFIDENIRSVHKVYHDYNSSPMMDKGPGDLNDIMRPDPARCDYALFWSLFNHNSSHNLRRLVVYPFPSNDYTLKMDANIFIPELVDTDDEPIIPLQHRQLLYHYAKRSLAMYHGDQMATQIADADFQRWLAGFDAEFFPARDLPRIWVDNSRWAKRSRSKITIVE